MASLITFKKLQSALGGKVRAEAFAVREGVLHVSALEAEDLALAMRAAAEHGLKVGEDIRFGLERFAEVEKVDPVSCVVRVGANAALSVLEERLAQTGLTLGPVSPRAAALRVGEWLEGPHAGLRPIPGGRLEPAPLALEAALWNGLVYRSHASPRSAAGPDLDHLLLGANRRAGLIVRASLRAFPRPTTEEARVAAVKSPAQAVELLQRSLAVEAVPVRAALFHAGEHLLLEARFSGLAFRVHRDAARFAGVAGELGAREVRELSAPALTSQPVETEVGWDGATAALERAGGATVELHRIAREGAILASASALAVQAAMPAWAEPIFQQARGAS